MASASQTSSSPRTWTIPSSARVAARVTLSLRGSRRWATISAYSLYCAVCAQQVITGSAFLSAALRCSSLSASLGIRKVLPNWATVTISLGASLITGTAAVVVARLHIRSGREEELRTRRIEAASDFAKRFVGAADAVDYAVRQHTGDTASQDAEQREKARRDAEQLVGEVTPFLGPISLLFEETSQVPEKSRQALAELRRVVKAVQQSPWEDAESALVDAHSLRREFETSVLAVAGYERQPWWRH